MQIVARQNTPLSAPDAVRYTKSVLPDLGPGLPLILALAWVETGAGKKAQNYSPGNVTANKSWAGDAWRPPWFDDTSTPLLASLHAEMLAGRAPSAFRAYKSWETGFGDWAQSLRRTFPEVLDASKTGDPSAFVQALSIKYSKNYGARHVPTFASLQRKFAPLAGSATPNTSPPQTGGGPGLLALLLIGARGLL